MGEDDDEMPDLTYPRQVSEFYLDRFEVTVGRFSSFVAHFALPLEGDGQHPKVANSGWRKSWESLPHPDHPGETAVPTNSAQLLTQVSDPEHCATGSTWDDGNQTLPVNCVNWYMAFAFCFYDGGRLPTEAEWNYAATLGSAQRPYPWSESPADTTIDASHAAYYDSEPIKEAPSPVGSYAAGRGGFLRHVNQGHDDLAGNVAEWVADFWLDPPPASCGTDCLAIWSNETEDRVQRGGAFRSNSSGLRAGYRTYSAASNIKPRAGFRCARDISSSPGVSFNAF